MKIWYGYGSEHSMNLVMIGRFKDPLDADGAKQIIERIKDQVDADVQAGLMLDGEPTDRFSDGMRDLFKNVSVYTISPFELGQFSYDVSVEVDNGQVIITTEEGDVSAFLKVLIDKGARVEVYSAHHYPSTEYGRGR